jgi:hypothetical protein
VEAISASQLDRGWGFKWLKTMFESGASIAEYSSRRSSHEIFGAWLLGVPTGLIVIWFLFNHVH